MSQHTFRTTFRNRPVKVLMGWDRPLRGFFMTIDYLDNPKDEDIAYCNLDDMALIEFGGLPPTLDHFKAVLAKLKISLPELMLKEVQADGDANMGNRYVTYNAEGQIQ